MCLCQERVGSLHSGCIRYLPSWSKQIWVETEFSLHVLRSCSVPSSGWVLLGSAGAEAPLLDMTTPPGWPSSVPSAGFPRRSPVSLWLRGLIFQLKDFITLWKLTTFTFLWQLSTLIWSSNLASTGISQSPQTQCKELFILCPDSVSLPHPPDLPWGRSWASTSGSFSPSPSSASNQVTIHSLLPLAVS